MDKSSEVYFRTTPAVRFSHCNKTRAADLTWRSHSIFNVCRISESDVRMKFAFQKTDALYVLEIPRREKRRRAVFPLYLSWCESATLGAPTLRGRGGEL